MLQGLLQEQIPINDLPRIYESLSLAAKVSNDPRGSSRPPHRARPRLSTANYIEQNSLRVIMIDPLLEQSDARGLRPSDQGTQILLGQNTLESILDSLRDTVGKLEESGQSAVLVCAPASASGHPPAGVGSGPAAFPCCRTKRSRRRTSHRNSGGRACHRVDIKLRLTRSRSSTRSSSTNTVRTPPLSPQP